MGRLFTIFTVATVAILATGQSIPANTTGNREASSGTLNLVLANRNGFVIAADSRRTAANGHHWDDSQKLFSVGKRSALVIAGFAAAAAPGTPLDVQVSALLREHFDDKLQKRKVSFIGQDVSGWMRLPMAQELQVVGAVFGSFGYYQMDMSAIIAGYDVNNKPKIVRFEFKPQLQPYGPALTMLPVFDTEITSIDVKGFKWSSAGIDSIANAVMAGTYASSDQRIVRYYTARERNQLDRVPLEVLRQLAEAILDETQKSTVLVGGPSQIAVFPHGGNARWLAPEMQSSKQRVLRTILWLGGPSNVKRQDGQHFTMRMSAFEDLTRPVTEQYTQVFVGGVTQDVDVALDGNIFAGCMFSDVTFKYKGGSFWFGDNNTLQRCEVEIEQGSALPPGTPLERKCRIIPKVGVQTDKFTVGTPLKPTHVGCIIPTKNGPVKTKITGQYKGQDCRGSHIEVPIGMPIPGGRSSRTQ
jgi:hypothetical protein